MIDVNKRLKLLGARHLPPKFDAKKGIAKLFPGGRPCKISQISGAIHSFGTTNAGTPSGEVMGTFLVMVDWCGNWFFDFYMAEQASQSGVWGAGFVFAFSGDGVGRGFTTTGNYSTASDTAGCSSQSVWGNDSWIRDNWTKLITEGYHCEVANSSGGVFGNSPPDIAGDTQAASGFGSLVNLGGANLSAIQQGSNIDGSCWFVGSPAWGVPESYAWLGGEQKGGASGEVGLSPGSSQPWAPGAPSCETTCIPTICYPDCEPECIPDCKP
ncbi:MAG: hypothetical protein OK456_10740 [Thaumarchaeota archaeon]|nr:hypothetical protein [Nitrososphaerota archaeon]